MAKRSYDGESTYAFGKRLGSIAEMLDEVVSGLAELGRQAEEDQPAGVNLCDEIKHVTAWVAGCADRARQWPAMFRNGPGNNRDVQRVEAPRKGSRNVESRADVGRAIRDV